MKILDVIFGKKDPNRLITVTMLVGLVGSGKSTWAKEYLKKNKGSVVISSDEIRDKNPGISNNNEKVFSIFYGKLMNAIRNDVKEIVLDATHINIKDRKHTFELIDSINEASLIENGTHKVVVEALVFNTPYDECVKRVVKRNLEFEKAGLTNRIVPLEIAKRYRERFQFPLVIEGFSKVTLLHPYKKCNKKLRNSLIDSMKDFPQDNPHHKESLSEHIDMVRKRIYFTCGVSISTSYESSLLYESALFHDIGKLYTKTYNEKKGHSVYYNHDNVGAYEMICNVEAFDMELFKNFNIASNRYLINKLICIINYHMVLFNQFDGNRDKLELMVGSDLASLLVAFSVCDNEGRINTEKR